MEFERYIGVDYSGAKTATSSLSGLRVYTACAGEVPVEVLPPRSALKYWSRRGLAQWLVNRLREPTVTLVGIDHGFSFPREYFDRHGLAYDWPAFLDDFQRHWPTDEDDVYLDFIRDGVIGNAAARQGNSKWRRLTERRTRTAKSVFHFDVPGSVAHSTHAGLPWLRGLRNELGAAVHFWPFDGWEVKEGVSVVAEVYPSVWSHQFPNEGRTKDQHDAFSIVAWLAEACRSGELASLFKPNLSDDERAEALFEGWILGCAGYRGQ